MICPKCQSWRVVNKDVELKKMTHNAQHHAAHNAVHALQGHPTMLVLVGGAWLIGKVVHAVSHTWTCQNCKHTFS